MKINVQSGIAIIPEGETTVLVGLDKPVRLDKTIVNHCGSIYCKGSNGDYSGNWATKLLR